MNILHIAKIENDSCSGVCVVVPQHIISQQEKENVAFMNINDTAISGIKKQILYEKPFKIENVIKVWDKPDLVVFHEIYRIEFMQIKNELKKENIPYIIIPHGSLTKNAQKKSRMKKILGNFLLFNGYVEGAKAIQFLSEAEMESSIGKEKGFIGTNGINIPQKSKENFNTDCTKILYIGRTEVYYKGLDLLIEAVSLIKEFLVKENVRIYIFGPDCNGSHGILKELTERFKVLDIVTLNDGITGKEKEEKLLESDIFIQTSRSEGMPTGVLEALSCGLPCIVTTGTTLGEKISNYDAGWVADVNARSIADGIKKAVLDKCELKNKSDRALNLITEEFLWGKVCQTILFEYKKIVRPN